MGIDVEKKYEIKSVNQEIYRQMRLTLDAATKDFNDKQYEKIKKEWEEEENKAIMESVDKEEDKIVGDLNHQCGLFTIQIILWKIPRINK